jgi:TIR domain/Pentapeptide repeats (8 copies)
MANEEHLARLTQGVAVWNRWRFACPEIRPDLYEADLGGMHLREVNLRGADLRGTDLGEADLAKADLYGADLKEAGLVEADLKGADLGEADLRGADLSDARLASADIRGTDFSGADLRGANLTDAALIRANLTKAKMEWTILADVDLSTVRGLETVQHYGPSTIGIDTLYRSQGNIPEAFLRGAGVPDEMITYTKSLVGRAFEYNSCFISYSSKDQEFAERLYADLQNKGVRCWFAPHDIQGGRKLHEQIDEAIRIHERLLLILSAHSMQSEWVKTEIAKARQCEVQEKRQVLFPMSLVSFEAIHNWECFDADTGKDSAREIREYFIPDFSNWKDREAYRTAFQRLLRDLKPNTILL